MKKKIILLASLLFMSIGAFPRFKYEKEVISFYIIEKKVDPNLLKKWSNELDKYLKESIKIEKHLTKEELRISLIYIRRLSQMMMDMAFTPVTYK